MCTYTEQCLFIVSSVNPNENSSPGWPASSELSWSAEEKCSETVLYKIYRQLIIHKFSPVL